MQVDLRLCFFQPFQSLNTTQVSAHLLSGSKPVFVVVFNLENF